MFTDSSELIGDIEIGGSLGCRHHTLVEFTVLRGIGQAKSKVRNMNFRKANFQLFKKLVSRTPWEMSGMSARKGRSKKAYCPISKDWQTGNNR